MIDLNRPQASDKKPSARQIANALGKLRAGQPGTFFARTAKQTESVQHTAQTSHETLAEEQISVATDGTATITPQAPRFVPTKRETMRFLFSPQIGLSLQGLTQSFTMMVRTFALLFISVNLLPKDHPAATLRGAQSYGLISLITEAARRLKFTRQNMPQISVFLSIVAFLVCGFMLLLTLFMKLAFGVAFAQTATPPTAGTNSPGMGAAFTAGAGDFAINFIDSVFDPNNQSSILGGISEMFKLYSLAVLILAGIILVFIVISAVAETARTGVPFGKQFNPVWAPIRLIVAIGLLVPLANGLNSGQLLTIGVAKWGSTQASNIWTSFAKKIDENKGAVTPTPVRAGEGRELVDHAFDIALRIHLQNFLAQEALGLNMEATSLDAPNAIQVSAADNDIGITFDSTAKTPDKTVTLVTWGMADQNTSRKDFHGGFGFPGIKDIVANTENKSLVEAQKSAQKILNAQSQVIKDMMSGANNIGGYRGSGGVDSFARIAANAAKDLALGNTDGLVLPSDFATEYSKFKNSFIESRRKKVAEALSANEATFGSGIQDDIQRTGWMGAATWLNRVANANGVVMDAVSTTPTLIKPSAPASIDDGSAGQEFQMAYLMAKQGVDIKNPQSAAAYNNLLGDKAKTMLEKFQNITKASNNPMGTLAASGRQLMYAGVNIVIPEANDFEKGLEKASTYSNSQTTEYFNKSANRDRLEKALILNSGNQSLIDRYKSSADQDDILKQKLNERLYPIGMAMITFGFQLGYLLPLIPFFRFFIGILGWIVLLFEAVLAIPLLALAHLKTDGEGFMSSMTQQGYLMILGLILKPILMVFGLILGLVAFNAIAQIANSMIAPAAAEASGGDVSNMVSIGMTMLLYASFLTVIANSAFKTIDILPGQVMRWIGAQMDSKMDDASAVSSSAMGTVSGFGMLRAFGGQGVAGGSRGGFGGASAAGTGSNTGPVTAPPLYNSDVNASATQKVTGAGSDYGIKAAGHKALNEGGSATGGSTGNPASGIKSGD